jgi:hypothetical protein
MREMSGVELARFVENEAARWGGMARAAGNPAGLRGIGMDDVATVPEATPVVGLLSLATAYQSSFALFAAARLGLADWLSETPRTAEDVAARRAGTRHPYSD